MPMLVILSFCWKRLAKYEIDKNGGSISHSECQHATASEVALCLPNGTAHRLRIAEQFGFLLPYMP